MPSSAWLRTTLIVGAVLLSPACAGRTVAARSGSAAPADILPALVGDWTGVLEYADYRTGARVQLPTQLAATLASGALQVAFTYREPSGITVNGNSLHRALNDGRRYVIGTDTLTTLFIDGFHRMPNGAAAAGVASFIGTAVENDVVVPARHTIILRGDSLVIRKETGDPPRFRNEYRFHRDGGG